MQPTIDAAWLVRAAQIYREYSLYALSNGEEQLTFSRASGDAVPRSMQLVECILSSVKLPREGRLLDIGCGNGSFLRRFGCVFPRWSLSGLDLDERHREVVNAIPGVEGLHAGDLERVPGGFSFISLVHVLLHIPNPLDYLTRLVEKLAPGGLLLVHLPDYWQNPFVLLISDVAVHFSLAGLRAMVESLGFEVVAASRQWILKEQSILARRIGSSSKPRSISIGEDGARVATALRWLRAVLRSARRCAKYRPFGLFGTSIAATWLAAELGEDVDFFVDEDPNRVGKTFMGRPIYHPSQAPRDSNVFLGISPLLAEPIRRRLARPAIRFHLPPVFEPAANSGGETNVRGAHAA